MAPLALIHVSIRAIVTGAVHNGGFPLLCIDQIDVIRPSGQEAQAANTPGPLAS